MFHVEHCYINIINIVLYYLILVINLIIFFLLFIKDNVLILLLLNIISLLMFHVKRSI